MKYSIFGESFPAVRIIFEEGEEVFTNAGALAWKDDGIEMVTESSGGFGQSIMRMISGTSLMFVHHIANKDGQEAVFASTMPGTIKKFDIDYNHEMIAQKNAFLVGTKGVEVEGVTVNKGFAGLFGGEGFVLQKFSGNGTVFVEVDGYCQEIELEPGQKIVVNTGNVAAFESQVEYDIEKVKGLKNVLFGGEGLFLTTLKGPGKVYLQTNTAKDIALRLYPYMPKETNVNTGNNN